MAAYVHGQTTQGSGLGKIGTLIHLSREDHKVNDKLGIMANNLSMHIAAMKPAYLKKEQIPDSVTEEVLAGENGERALKKFIKRDVLWEQDLATADKSETVGKFLTGRSKAMGTQINVENWALFMI